jgi:6-phosphogluconolactonase
MSTNAPSHLYIGTYTRTTSRGVYRLAFDARTGALGEPVLVAEARNPTWLAWAPDRRTMFVTDAGLEGVRAYAVGSSGDSLRLLNHQPSGAGHPTHLIVDASGRMLVSANYGSGTVTAWPIRPDGSLGEPSALVRHTGSSVDPERQKEPHAHGVTLSPDQRFLFVPDLGIDKVMIYAIDPASATLSPHTQSSVSVPAGGGPRHLAFAPDGRHAYVINEMGGTVSVFAYDAAAGHLDPVETVPTLPEGYTEPNKTAEIVVHPNGHYVYGSNRGHDSIVVYARNPADGRLTPVETVPSGGRSPRHFDLSPDGNWLVTLHEDSHDGFVFRVDPGSGRLTRTPHTLSVPQPVCVLFGP